ncbi:uncharacterized protein LOC135198193 [Macrobrachium nipponense]|uniref:uncharacterized protein LOC135198193 n=1 Tax=Macrobrachium nipponense TaxID=159736 RepID=UPI0030C88B05
MPAPSNLRGAMPAPNEVSPPEEYFRGVSTLCRRMLDDMSAVKESFGDHWNQLSYHQQCRVIDQAIVDEATVRRYESGGATGPECEYFPKLKLPTGQKVVCDETLTARGFSCSWRDEHSAPFSWHTRSQMDLTLDTPPDTPTHPSTPTEASFTTIEGEGRVIPGGRAVYSARPVSLPRPPRFRWHYDPPDGLPDPPDGLPDPPSVVVAAPKSATLPSDIGRAPQKSSQAMKYMLIRGKGDENEKGGLMAKIRGVVSALTATCLPLRAAPGPTSHLSIHNASEGGREPELRPLRVQTQSSKCTAGQVSDQASSRMISKQSNTLEPQKGCQGPFATITGDPSLSGYMCSLPDDEDDVPYTVHNTSQFPPSHCGELSATSHTSPADVTQTSETAAANMAMSNLEDRHPDSNIYSAGLSPSSFMSPTASLPTPVPTPTAGNPNNPVENFPTMCTSTPILSCKDHQMAARPKFQQPDLITDTYDSQTTDIGCRVRSPTLEEKQSDVEDNGGSSTPILAMRSESIIPKTGFDFLDNW